MNIRQIQGFQQVFIVFLMKTFTPWIPICRTTNIIPVPELFWSASAVLLISFPFFQNCFKYIIRYWKFTHTSRCFCFNFLLCQHLRCTVFCFTVWLLSQLTLDSQRPVNVIDITVFQTIYFTSSESHQYRKQNLHMNRCLLACLNQSKHLRKCQCFLLVNFQDTILCLFYFLR